MCIHFDYNYIRNMSHIRNMSGAKGLEKNTVCKQREKEKRGNLYQGQFRWLGYNCFQCVCTHVCAHIFLYFPILLIVYKQIFINICVCIQNEYIINSI
jgi:hypothetical protein